MEPTLTPIEQAFWDVAEPRIKGLESQQWIEQFQVDFVVQCKCLVIELDGHEFHSSREQRTNDAARQRVLQRLGYSVIRFTGSEIHADVNACVDETIEQLSLLPEHEEFLRTNERVRYCIRMKEVITHLLDKFGRDVASEEFSLRLSKEHFDDLFIERQGPLISVAHFYFPNATVALPDPRVAFIIVPQGPKGYDEWAPVILGQLCQGRSFAKVNEQDKIVVTNFKAQHDAAEYAEGWAQRIRLNGWLSEGKEVV